ncbi:MAG: triose-phosphate isomerase [Ancalomicrobiaceae bacterium]|nr:triose-phosphate isomerase [Ancalomicrobiaceae bacterium]
MRTFWIGTGWKMNKTAAEARDYIATFLSLRLEPAEGVRLFVVPPFTALAAVREAIGASPLLLGAQNMHWAEAGACTGEISIGMLMESSVDLVELGHSERRAQFGETDAAINLKVKTALSHGVRPLVCVGDSAEERDAGASAEAVVRQVKLAFAGVSADDLGRCLIAYEPIWAIGETGVAASQEHVRRTHRAIHNALEAMTPHPVPVLYGGSVDHTNVAEFAREPSVDGLFIGRAAWRAEGFAALITAAVLARSSVRLPEGRAFR